MDGRNARGQVGERLAGTAAEDTAAEDAAWCLIYSFRGALPPKVSSRAPPARYAGLHFTAQGGSEGSA
jgi:hypothetical protein